MVAGEVVFGMVLAIALHLYVAKPLTEALRRLSPSARPAPVSASAAPLAPDALDSAIKALRAVAREGRREPKPRKEAA